MNIRKCKHDKGFYVDIVHRYQQFYNEEGHPIGTSGTVTEYPNAAYCEMCNREIGIAEVDSENYAKLKLYPDKHQ